MATKVDKKNAIRQGITEAEIVYFQNLAGKTFLYVCGDEYFEVSFPIDHFLHLTGVETRLSTKDFYKNAKKSILATVYKGNIIKNLIMDCQSYTKYRPNETTGGIFVSWRRKEELPTGA